MNVCVYMCIYIYMCVCVCIYIYKTTERTSVVDVRVGKGFILERECKSYLDNFCIPFIVPSTRGMPNFYSDHLRNVFSLLVL
jgi:hypothetical protein